MSACFVYSPYLHIVQNRRANEVALFITGYFDVASIEEQCGALLHTGLDQFEHALFGALGDQRT